VVWWQVVSAIGSLALAVPAATIGVLAFRRTAHADEIEDRVRAIEAEAEHRVAAAEVGLKYLERSLAAQQETITRQSGEIGELRGQLKDCRTEREDLAHQIAELRGRMP
jgi:chromosome segregation ATPase